MIQNKKNNQEKNPVSNTMMKYFPKWYAILFLLLLLVGSIIILKKSSKNVEIFNTGKVFGTLYHIKYYSEKNYEQDIYHELLKVDSSMSIFNKKSLVSAINENRSMQTDTLLRKVFALSENVSKQTQGAFDVTVAPLVNAWGFGFKHRQMPNSHQVDSLRQFIGYQKVQLVNDKIQKKDPRIMLDFGAIAKGFGVDQVADFLESKGVYNYMIEIGGEVRVRGHKYENAQPKPWAIGLDKPLENEDQLQTILPIRNCAVATSGNYRNFYYKNGKKYAHTIDPKLGRPVQHSLLSSSVVASTCAEADAYATAFMVMGVEKAKKILEKNPKLKAYFIYEDKGQMKVWTNIPNIK